MTVQYSGAKHQDTKDITFPCQTYRLRNSQCRLRAANVCKSTPPNLTQFALPHHHHTYGSTCSTFVDVYFGILLETALPRPRLVIVNIVRVHVRILFKPTPFGLRLRGISRRMVLHNYALCRALASPFPFSLGLFFSFLCSLGFLTLTLPFFSLFSFSPAASCFFRSFPPLEPCFHH